jgi:aminopeptidase
MRVADEIIAGSQLGTDFLTKNEQILPLFKRLLSENLGAKDEQLLILNDRGEPGFRIAPMLNALYAAAAEELGLSVHCVSQGVKRRGDVADRKVIEALDKLPEGSLILLNASGRLGNMDRLGLSYRTFCNKRKHRFFSSSNWGLLPEKEFSRVIRALDVDYEQMSKEGAALKKLLDAASEVRITTPEGTDVTFKKAGMKCINNDGYYLKPGRGGNMPAGEVYFPPIKRGVEGVIVIDGSYRTKDASLIPEEPIIMTIKEGEIVALNDTPEAKALQQTLEWAEERAKFPWGIRRMCELGIGLNPGAKLIGCTILDEKVRGTVHVANGSNKWFGGDVAAIIHLDHVMKHPTIYIDGKKVEIPQ